MNFRIFLEYILSRGINKYFLRPGINHKYKHFTGLLIYREHFSSFTFQYITDFNIQKICSLFNFKSGTIVQSSTPDSFKTLKIYKTVYCNSAVENIRSCEIDRSIVSKIIEYNINCSMINRKKCAKDSDLRIDDICFRIIHLKSNISVLTGMKYCNKINQTITDFITKNKVFHFEFLTSTIKTIKRSEIPIKIIISKYLFK